MGETIKQSQLRNDNAAVMKRVASGESFTVTVNGRPVADLVPHQRRTVVPAEEMDRLLADDPVVDAGAWRRDRVKLPDDVQDPHSEGDR
ncbi:MULTISPECIES: type II toxin-antitoxin system prevent-host-death family antitoxin [unclassified Pseudonocardia]|uniref:type II toxin-antitoxin system Phd/YefM family antitoxin n=1 Tax=unclassified Pseudonocardia TaxID=2619320 RepID=UPI0001FFE42E|nr:type II toxin-antitoxin system prevent-host-death family antitoxin [Pseudonocardia sp. Ae707_Ps1]OLM18609.1 hypothetical protein Ae707Ps1_2868c [Pseudonocardia sp. Ae707_Ps1]